MTAPIILPSKPFERGAATSGSQRDRRFTDTFYDVHKHPTRFPMGRPWTGEREFRSGAEEASETAGFITSDLQQGAYFCENPQMGQTATERADTLNSVWSAPWVPIAKYFRFNMRRKQVQFAYDKMIADEKEGLARYWDAAARLAGENDVIDPERPLAVPFRIRTILGLPTTYSGKIRLAQAAQAGDPWLLGFVEEPNIELAKILGINISPIGGRAGDAEYTSVPSVKQPEPKATPDQVLGMSAEDLAKMVAAAVEAAMAARERKPAGKKRNSAKNFGPV